MARAIYLVEYAKRGTKIVKAVRLTAETLSGIPSIVYGLFGMLFFVTALRWGYSLLAGAYDAGHHDSAPDHAHHGGSAAGRARICYREGSFGLGAGRLRTVFAHRAASAPCRGILAGVILAIGRIVGETAALIYTAGTVAATAR